MFSCCLLQQLKGRLLAVLMGCVAAVCFVLLTSCAAVCQQQSVLCVWRAQLQSWEREGGEGLLWWVSVSAATSGSVHWRVWVGQTTWQECRIGGTGLHCTDWDMCRL